ncbi:YaaL family protein [Anoxybacteroides tepidamans]|uniref:YaaL family protein n=1 Tax=Anoxybacteroides tepidamans TaxID=265948 RepID=UPI00048A0E46|nr:YaaL family protein [Anoxybacillus tepidamans]
MFWRRKGWLKKQFDQQLIKELESMRDEWMKQKHLIEKSIEPSAEVLMDLKITEAKYFFLIREAKRRRLSLKGAK